jgi:bifunctional non-homologous end joining protein LigD
VAIRTREIYRSAPNGDRWLLAGPLTAPHKIRSGRLIKNQRNQPSSRPPYGGKCSGGALATSIETAPSTRRETAPSGSEWLHEIKHDGFRLMACRAAVGIRLLTRNGNDFTARYPLIVEAVEALPVRSCVIDGEAVACNGDGLSIFEKLRWRHHDERVFMWSFDLLELDGQDLRREPIEVRKATLASVLRSCRAGLQFNQHLEHPGDIVFRHACKMGLEGIVSKRLGSRYVSGRSRDWLKFKNPSHPAVKREAEEDWGKGGMAMKDRTSGTVGGYP